MFGENNVRSKGTGKGRKAAVVLVAVMVLCFAATLFFACNKGEELPSVTPVSWERYLSDATARVAEHIALNGGKLGAMLRADVVSEGGAYDLLVGLNYDANAVEESCFVIELVDADAVSEAAETAAEEGVLFSLVADNSATWVDVAPGLDISDARVRIENLNIFGLLGAAYNDATSDAAVKALADILFNLGRAFFSGVSVSDGGDVYTFTVNADFKSDGAAYFSSVLTVFGEEVSDALLAAFGIEDADALFQGLPDMRGEVVLTFGDDGVGISTDRLTTGENGAGMNAVFTVSDELFPELTAKVPDGTEVGYVTTKIGNSHMSGKVEFTRGDNSIMSYDYELDANLDLLTLALAGYDLTALDEDNYFHLRITHTCSATCGAFCDGRYASARGAVLDIAFSPQDFAGSYNVFFSVALQALLPESRAAELSGTVGSSLTDLGSTLMGYLPEYTLITYPYSLFDIDSPVCEMLTALYAGNMFATGVVEVPIDPSDDLVRTVEEIMGKDAFGGADGIRLIIEQNDFGLAQPHDIYSDTVYIIDDSVGDVKNYGLHLSGLALSWEWEAPHADEASGEELVSLYTLDGTLLHGVAEDGEYVPISPEELTGMLGEYGVKARRLGIDKTAQFDYYARVLSVEGVDLDERGVQDVVFTVEYPNPLSALGLDDVTAGNTELFTMQVKGKIKLTSRTEDEVVFTPHVPTDTCMEIISADNPGVAGVYSGLRSSMPDFVYADAKVTYEGGAEKSTVVVGECEGVGTRDALLFTYYYSTMCGEVTVHWEFLDGEEDGKYFVTPPDRIEYDIDAASMPSHSVGETVYMATITNHVTATAYYDYDDGTHKAVRANLTAENIFINGIPLSASSTYWRSERLLLGGYKVTFNVANKYECRIEVFNKRSDTFFLNVEAYLGDEATYTFNQTSTDPVFWFAGKDYRFTGEIDNATHGIADDAARTLHISVFRNYDSTSSNSAIDISSESCDVWLKSFTADSPFVASGTAGQMTAEDFPALIVVGIDVSFTLRFNEPGYYCVRLQLTGDGGFSVYWYITVADSGSTNMIPPA